MFVKPSRAVPERNWLLVSELAQLIGCGAIRVAKELNLRAAYPGPRKVKLVNSSRNICEFPKIGDHSTVP